MVELILVPLGLIFGVMLWQHLRYQRCRRDLAQDLQHPLHAADAFHVVVLFKLFPGDKVVRTARQFKQQLQSFSKARLIYAGQAAFTVNAPVLGNHDWDGVLLFQFPSRAEYESSRTDARTSQARQLFSNSYVHGLRRNRSSSLLAPQRLLRHRFKDFLCGKFRIAPLQRSPMLSVAPELQHWHSRVDRLLALHEINRQGMVVLSLAKEDKRDYSGASKVYNDGLLSRMAALNYGPLHIGRSIALEGLARFNRIHIIYYPSARYFVDLISSELFLGAQGNKLVDDSVRIATAPITARLCE